MTDAQSGDVVPFDMDSIKTRIKEQVRASFLGAIPPEAFKEMVDKEIRAFLEVPVKWEVVDRTEGDLYRGPKRKLSASAPATPFRVLVWDAMREMTASRISDLLNDPDHYGVSWDGAESRLGDAMRNVVKENAPLFVEALLEHMVLASAGRAQNGIRDAIMSGALGP